MEDNSEKPKGISRRKFLGAAGAAGAAAATAGFAWPLLKNESTYSASSNESLGYNFRGNHQAGVTAPRMPAGLVAGLDVRVDDKRELEQLFVRLSESIELLMSGARYEDRSGGFPPADTGLNDRADGYVPPWVVLSVGDSLFDSRFGLASLKPRELQPMPKFNNDYMVKPATSHGDLSVAIGGVTHESVIHGFRQLMRSVRGSVIPKWTRSGFNSIRPDIKPGIAPGRNLMGFKDGTANPDPQSDSSMNEIVWVQPNDLQPEWALGGTYLAVRVIRMMVEFWDRTRLNEQEELIGRSRDSGAPLGMKKETDEPRFTSFESHIARANPRTSGSEENLMLRNGFNYADGLDGNDQMDQGLVFLSYQRSLEKGFITVQRRLDGEALEEYIRPLGGGFFFVLPGPGQGSDPLGASLLA